VKYQGMLRLCYFLNVSAPVQIRRTLYYQSCFESFWGILFTVSWNLCLWQVQF